MRLCSGCGSKNRESARFCDQCGVRIESAVPAAELGALTPGPGYTPKHLAEKVFNSRAAMVGERKLVTVLFADIKGSTRLAEQVGAEAWHGILNQFFAILTGAVHRLEGTVNQYTGDGIMALFGAPIAHEDHASRACFAALEMQRELKRFGDDLRTRRSLDLQIRIGLNTGEVVVGRIGDDLRMDYTAKGLTVNLAARMEQICTPGRINISRYTAAQIGGDFMLRDLGDQQVDGASHPIRVYELEGEHLTSAQQHRAAENSAQPLIGRIPELDQLQDALTAARGGSGQIVTVTGDAGIGKSRLCRDFAQLCWSRGVAVHHAVCIPYSAAVPLVPVRALLRSRLGLNENASAADVQHIVRRIFDSPNAQRSAVIPLIADFLGAGGTEASGNVRSLMMQRIARFLPQSPRLQVLIIEDLQYADAATADFMQRLCEQVAGSSTLLLLSHRSEWTSAVLAPFYDRTLELEPLSAAEVERMARGLLGPAIEVQEIAAGLADRAQGNPFFVEEAIKALAETGHLGGEPGQYTLVRTIEQWPVPQSVHALIGGRIDRLQEEQKNLLQAAAIIGRRFDADLLDAFAGGGFFKANVAALVNGGFIQGHSDGLHYEFCHPLTLEVAYQTQLESARAQLHAALAEVLEERVAPAAAASEEAVTLAHHWTQAANWERAGTWNMHAALWFAPRDIEAALHQYRLAIQHLDRADYSFEVLRHRIGARAGLIRLAQFMHIEREEVDRLYGDAWRMAEEFQDIECGAELLFSYSGEMLQRGEADTAVQLATDAVSHAQAAGASKLIDRFRFSVLMAHNAAGRFEPGLQLATTAGSDWLLAPISEENFMSRAFYGEMCTWRGRLAEARAHLEASLAWAEANQRECIWQCALLVDWAGFAGALESSVARGEQAVRLAQRFGSPFYKALALRALGLALCHSRRCEDALRVLDEAGPLAAQSGGAYPLQASLLAVTAAAHVGLKKWNLAQRMADEALASARRSNMRMGELQAWMIRLRIPGAAPGFAMEGIQRMHQLIELTGAEVFRPWWLRAHARFADAEESAELRTEAGRLLLAMGARVPAASA